MEPPKYSVGPASNPLQSLPAFIYKHTSRLGAKLASRLDDTKRLTSKFAAHLCSLKPPHPPASYSCSSSPLILPFASVTQSLPPAPAREGKGSSNPAASSSTLSSDYVSKTLAGTSVYAVSDTNNEFVLISDPNGAKSIGLLCFRYEDAQAFLAQVKSTKGVKGGAKVVPITLEQSDLLVVKKKKRWYCPIYFRKEDIEKELSMVSRSSRGAGVSQHIVVGSLENVFKKMETSERNSGWEDLIFVPQGKSHSQHIQEVTVINA